jgi:uncharacterized protein (DUF58 family)
MEYPRVKPRGERAPDKPPGAYANLDELIRLQYKATGFTFLPRQPIHSILAGRHASRLRGRGLNFEEIRRYLPGDDVRNIDWKVTARVQKPHVRVYTEEKDRPALLVVDQRMSMFFGSRRALKSVVAAEAAALAAWRVLSMGDRVGAIVFGDEEVTEIRPHRSQERVMQILRTVVKRNHELNVTESDAAKPRRSANAANFNAALQSALRVAHHDFLVVLITDGFGADDESVRLVTSICEHNDVMTLFIYDPLEDQLPDAGRVVISEADSQLEVDTSDAKLRRLFHGDFQQRFEWIRDISRIRSIPLLPIETGHGVAEQVRKLLGHAGRR